MALRSLEEFNQSRVGNQRAFNAPRPNGIACPECGNELMDTAPAMTLTSNPPQKSIGCSCGYRGYRIA